MCPESICNSSECNVSKLGQEHSAKSLLLALPSCVQNALLHKMHSDGQRKSDLAECSWPNLLTLVQSGVQAENIVPPSELLRVYGKSE